MDAAAGITPPAEHGGPSRILDHGASVSAVVTPLRAVAGHACSDDHVTSPSWPAIDGLLLHML